MPAENCVIHNAKSAQDAARLRGLFGSSAVIVGGGTMVVPDITRGTRRKSLIITLRQAGLNRIEAGANAVRLGAMVSYSDLLQSDLIAKRLPLLRHVAGQITGGPQIRNQGTVGGSACFANPASDIPAVLVALGATMHVQSESRQDEIPAERFFLSAFSAAIDDNEILSGISIPWHSGAFGYYKLKTSESSWPILTAAAVLTPLAGSKHALRLAVGGASSKPYLCTTEIDASATDVIAPLATSFAEAMPDEWSDELAGPGYRRRAAPAVIRRSIAMAMESARV